MRESEIGLLASAWHRLGASCARVTINGSWAGSSMVEQLPLKQRVGGSSPPRLTTPCEAVFSQFRRVSQRGEFPVEER
jgi:hypothetical protein